MNLRHRIQLALLSGCASLFSLLGFGGLSRLGSGFGRLMWHALPARRKLATDNIIRHLNLPENEARALARASFRHNARSFAEILLTDRFGMTPPVCASRSRNSSGNWRPANVPSWRQRRIWAHGNCWPPCWVNCMRSRARAWWWCGVTPIPLSRHSFLPGARRGGQAWQGIAPWPPPCCGR